MGRAIVVAAADFAIIGDRPMIPAVARHGIAIDPGMSVHGKGK
jgi:hypothetical protein